jgi:hypothetical protein
MINWPNMLLVAGTGRNVGKTTFVCKVIENVSKKSPIVAVKITPHVHDFCDSCVTLFKSDKLTITEETSKTLPKDSSKMLAAGAQKVYFIQGADDQLDKVIEFLQEIIPESTAIICESAALRNFINPSLFVLMSVSNEKSEMKNADKIPLANAQIVNYMYNSQSYQFENGVWNLNET